MPPQARAHLAAHPDITPAVLAAALTNFTLPKDAAHGRKHARTVETGIPLQVGLRALRV